MPPRPDACVVAISRQGQQFLYFFARGDLETLRDHVRQQLGDPELDLDLKDAVTILGAARRVATATPLPS